MTMRAHLFLLVNLIIIWLVGLVFSYAYRYKDIDRTSVDIKTIFKPFVRYQYFLMILSLILSVIIFFRVYSLINQFGGWWFFGDERFEEMMIIGPVAHLVQVSKVCFLFLFFIFPYSKRKKYILISLAFLIVSIALIQVKYHLIWMMIMGFLYLNLPKNLSGQLKGVATISLLVLIMMNIFWISLTFAWGTFSFQNEVIKDYLLNNSINYFVSGPILVDRWLDWPGSRPDWVLLTVFQNIYYILMGIPVRVDFIPLISHGFLETAPGVTSNVGTSFGLYYLIGGYTFAFFMTTFLAVISYWFYFKSMKCGSAMFVYLNLLFLTITMLSFFGQYFTTLSLYEMTVIFFLFIFVFKVLNWVKEYKST